MDFQLNAYGYQFKVAIVANGYTAECIDIEGCRTEAGNIDELIVNIKEVLDLQLKGFER